ncbi:hypothetical protein [Streptomonospora wellingtoniae]|uniref:Uncharacterized protein n=1 Tax=Streptomonospora wellingtoniae TaxID=3075544 RepID=A0ABU2KU24_9ACTN|nr:hypothetical protein [Streptomonospora sp. DSM 45055]MDT0302800.1 hypothetical protein [Streptomonospora sp. DSM 45055]
MVPHQREYTPPRLDDGEYARFAALSLEHRRWAVRHTADAEGELFEATRATHAETVVRARSLDEFARLLDSAEGVD